LTYISVFHAFNSNFPLEDLLGEKDKGEKKHHTNPEIKQKKKAALIQIKPEKAPPVATPSAEHSDPPAGAAQPGCPTAPSPPRPPAPARGGNQVPSGSPRL